MAIAIITNDRDLDNLGRVKVRYPWLSQEASHWTKGLTPTRSDRQLLVTTAQLQAVYVREPNKDKYSDRTLEATEQKMDGFYAIKISIDTLKRYRRLPSIYKKRLI